MASQLMELVVCYISSLYGSMTPEGQRTSMELEKSAVTCIVFKLWKKISTPSSEDSESGYK
jgi:hypothetical protein